MTDETLGTKTNRVGLNISQVMGTTLEPPEPGCAAVTVDGNPIHAVRSVQLLASVGQPTLIILQFECEATGVIGKEDVGDLLDRARNTE